MFWRWSGGHGYEEFAWHISDIHICTASLNSTRVLETVKERLMRREKQSKKY